MSDITIKTGKVTVKQSWLFQIMKDGNDWSMYNHLLMCYLILLSLADNLAILNLFQGVFGLLCHVIPKLLESCLEIGKLLLNCGLLLSLCVRRIKPLQKQFNKSHQELELEGPKCRCYLYVFGSYQSVQSAQASRWQQPGTASY